MNDLKTNIAASARGYITYSLDQVGRLLLPRYLAKRKNEEIARFFRQRKVRAAERALAEVVEWRSPAMNSLVLYLRKCILIKKAEHSEAIKRSRYLTDEQRRLIVAGEKYVVGEFREALAELRALPTTSRLLLSEYFRLSYLSSRQLGEIDGAIDFGLRYINTKSVPDLSVSAALISLGERAGNKEAVQKGLERALLDAEAIARSRMQFARQWETVVRFWVNIFDLDKAISLARQARELNLRNAEEILSTLEVVQAEVASISHLIDEARQYMVATASGETNAPDNTSISLVLSSAMLGFKKHDSASFRPSVRFVYSEIAAVLDELKRKPRILAKIDSRAQVGITGGGQYISYHTVSNQDNGLHFKEAYYPGTFTFDRNGYSGWSQFAKTRLEDLELDVTCPDEKVEAYFDELQKNIKLNASKYLQADISEEIQLPSRYVFVGLQVISDSVQQLARVPMLDMLDDVSAECELRGIATVVKRHPLCKSPLVSEILRKGVESGRWIISNASIHTLISKSCAVAVVNSGVGVEALHHLKPVYLFGDADYKHVCYNMTARGDFAQTFEPGNLPVSEGTIKKYLYFFRNNYLVDTEDREQASTEIRNRTRAFLLEPSVPGKKQR